MTQIANSPPTRASGRRRRADRARPRSKPRLPPAPNPADLRLVIEDDQAAGCFVYKTIDRRTGDVVQQLPREQLVKLREADAYLAGDVIKTQA